MAFRTAGEHITAIEYDKENPVNRGSLCPRGHYNLEMLNHPGRLTRPKIGKRPVSWDEAINFIKQELKLFSKEEIGITLSCLASNEDAQAVAKLARSIGTKNVCAAGYPADLEAYQGARYEVSGAQVASLSDVENAEALLIVGDLLNRAPVLSRRINRVKYGKKGNKIIVIDPNKTHTSWFATEHLQIRPGTEAAVLAAMLEKRGKAAEDFAAARSGVIIFVPSKNIERNDLVQLLVKMLAVASPGKKYITYYMYGNTLGVNSIIDHEIPEHVSYFEMLKKINSGEIKAILMLGEDLSASHPEIKKRFKFVARSDYFGGESAVDSDTTVLLPLASQLDGGGSYLLADGRIESLTAVAPKVGSLTNAEIVSLILGTRVEKGVKFEMPTEKIDLKLKVEEAKSVKGKDKAEIEPIVNFGSNVLTKNFFWYRVNTNG